jgi:hypothetical protein
MFVSLVFVVLLSEVSGIQSSVWDVNVLDCADKVLMQEGSEHITERGRCEVS